MVRRGLGIYAVLSRLGFPRSYLGKIAAVAFLGTHAPLLALALYLLASPGGLGAHAGALGALLLATLVGFAATLWALRGLLAPVRLTSRALKIYLDEGRAPDLPIGFPDEAGRLMADARYAVEHLDSTVRSLEGLSGTDHLTGLPNRREAERRLAEDAARTRRGGGEVLTVGVVDVNRFKQINDAFGHQAGDVCLRHVADVIGRNTREGDWMARWGGDEFLLVLRDASEFAPTEAVLGRIVGDLRRTPVRVPQGEELTLTVSVGAVRLSDGEGLARAIERADGAMYRAKREGRPWVLTV